jgi:hypothetical protein
MSTLEIRIEDDLLKDLIDYLQLNYKPDEFDGVIVDFIKVGFNRKKYPIPSPMKIVEPKHEDDIVLVQPNKKKSIYSE